MREWQYLIKKFIEIYGIYPICVPFPFCCHLPILGNSHFAFNTYYFVDQYLKGCIGELAFSSYTLYNNSVLDFLNKIFQCIRKEPKIKHDCEAIKFIENLYKFPYAGGGGFSTDNVFIEYFDNEGGGFGIVHTTINLGV